MHRSSIYRWLDLKKDTGNLKPRERTIFRTKRFSDDDLQAFVDNNPEALLKDIANHFDVRIPSVFTRLAKLKITRKKNDVIF